MCEDYLSFNGTQSVRLEKGTIEFNNHSPVPFKIYVDFECNLKGVEIYEGFFSKNIKVAFLLVLLTRLFLLMINLLSQYLFLGVKILLMNLLKRFSRSMNTVKK